MLTYLLLHTNIITKFHSKRFISFISRSFLSTILPYIVIVVLRGVRWQYQPRQWAYTSSHLYGRNRTIHATNVTNKTVSFKYLYYLRYCDLRYQFLSAVGAYLRNAYMRMCIHTYMHMCVYIHTYSDHSLCLMA